MILSHLVDIKAKIEQKSIYNIKLPFEEPFKDKYAGRSPARILCLYSVRLVSISLSDVKGPTGRRFVAHGNASGLSGAIFEFLPLSKIIAPDMDLCISQKT